VKFTSVAPEIFPTEIVSQNDHDIGPPRLGAGQ